jgi:hypothetical protein
MTKIDLGYRLSPERQLRLYTKIARSAIRNGELRGVGVALAAIENVQDAIARLQEHHVREERR